MELISDYNKQLESYKDYIQKLVNDNSNKKIPYKLIEILICMCNKVTGKLLKVGNVVLEKESSLEKEINQLVFGLNYITDISTYNSEGQYNIFLYSFLILLNIIEIQTDTLKE